MKIAIFHPDLGVGGAERLIVDTALELQQRGHRVTILTSHHSPSHCFEETKDGRLKIKVRGDWLPRSLFGYLHVLFATLRALFLALCFLLYDRSDDDILLVDQISASLPLLRMLSTPIFFYCHFPDKLLSKPGGALKKIYRLPMDALEEWTLGFAEEIFVNSQFTARVFEQSFPALFSGRAKAPQVLYPGILLRNYEAPSNHVASHLQSVDRQLVQSLATKRVLLSLNRFERKKCIELALAGLDAAKQAFTAARQKEFGNVVLVIAGGYDPRVRENVEYLSELKGLADRLGLSNSTIWSSIDSGGGHGQPQKLSEEELGARVLFMPSITSQLRNHLLHSSEVLVYTPSHEHFGLVPVEAMACGLIVIAMNSGGPTESILHEKTGYLVEPSARDLGLTLCSILKKKQNDASLAALKSNAKERVSSLFTMEAFVDQLETRFRFYLKSNSGPRQQSAGGGMEAERHD